MAAWSDVRVGFLGERLVDFAFGERLQFGSGASRKMIVVSRDIRRAGHWKSGGLP